MTEANDDVEIDEYLKAASDHYTQIVGQRRTSYRCDHHSDLNFHEFDIDDCILSDVLFETYSTLLYEHSTITYIKLPKNEIWGVRSEGWEINFQRSFCIAFTFAFSDYKEIPSSLFQINLDHDIEDSTCAMCISFSKDQQNLLFPAIHETNKGEVKYLQSDCRVPGSYWRCMLAKNGEQFCITICDCVSPFAMVEQVIPCKAQMFQDKYLLPFLFKTCEYNDLYLFDFTACNFD